MEEKKNGMNQNNIGDYMPREIPIPDVEDSSSDSIDIQQTENERPTQNDLYGQQNGSYRQPSDTYQRDFYDRQNNLYVQQDNNPYGQQNNPYAQQDNNPYGRQNNPYAQQDNNPYGRQNNPYIQHNNPYGQQNNPYGQQVRPYIPREQRKGSAAKIVIGVACVIVLMLALIIGGMVYLRSTPTYKISKGFLNLGKEIGQDRNPLLEKIDLNDILLMMEEDGSHVESELNFSTDLSFLGNITLGVDTDFYKDVPAKELNADTSISVMNMDIAHVNIYANEDVFCFSIPELFMENMYIENENVVSQYNNSILAELGSRSDMEDFSIELFPDEDAMIRAQEWRDLDKIWGRFEDDLSACKEGMTIGKVEKGLYRVTLPAKETDRLLKDLLDSYGKISENGEELQLWKDYKKVLCSDVILLFEIDGRNRIDSIMLEEPVSLWDDTASVEGEVFFLGETISIDKIQAKVKINGVDSRTREMIGQLQQTSGKDSYQMELDVKYSEEEDAGKMKFVMNCDAAKDEFDMELSVKDDEDDIDITLEGSLDDIVKGESLELDLDHVTFSVNDEQVYKISGNIAIEPLQDRIKATVKPETALFEMSLFDWESIITNLDDAYGNLLDSLW